MRNLVLAIPVLLVTALCAVCPALAVDKALIGSWIGTVKGSEVRWEIRFGGNCSWTQNGPQGSVSDSGMITANDGQYMKSFNKGSDSGTYTFSGTDKFTTVSSKLGRTEWTRMSVNSGEHTTVSHSVPVGNSSSTYYSSFKGYNANVANANIANANIANANIANANVASTSASTAGSQNSYQQGSAQQTSNASAVNPASASDKPKSNKGGPSKFKQFIKGVGTAADVLTRPTDGSQHQYNNGYQSNNNQSNRSGGIAQSIFGGDYGVSALAGGNVGGNAHSMLIDNFPLRPAADEAAQFGLPGLARLAGGGMRKREFRAVF